MNLEHFKLNVMNASLDFSVKEKDFLEKLPVSTLDESYLWVIFMSHVYESLTIELFQGFSLMGGGHKNDQIKCNNYDVEIEYEGT